MATYLSYGLVTLDRDENYEFNHDNIEGIKQLREDALWMRDLPIYIVISLIFGIYDTIIVKKMSLPMM